MRIAVVGESNRPSKFLLDLLRQRGDDVRLFSPERNCRSLMGFNADRILILRDCCRHSVVDIARTANKQAEIIYINITSKSTITKMIGNF